MSMLDPATPVLSLDGLLSLSIIQPGAKTGVSSPANPGDNSTRLSLYFTSSKVAALVDSEKHTDSNIEALTEMLR